MEIRRIVSQWSEAKKRIISSWGKEWARKDSYRRKQATLISKKPKIFELTAQFWRLTQEYKQDGTRKSWNKCSSKLLFPKFLCANSWQIDCQVDPKKKLLNQEGDHGGTVNRFKMKLSLVATHQINQIWMKNQYQFGFRPTVAFVPAPTLAAGNVVAPNLAVREGHLRNVLKHVECWRWKKDEPKIIRRWACSKLRKTLIMLTLKWEKNFVQPTYRQK